MMASQVPQLDPTKLDQQGWDPTRLGIGDVPYDSKQHVSSFSNSFDNLFLKYI